MMRHVTRPHSPYLTLPGHRRMHCTLYLLDSLTYTGDSGVISSVHIYRLMPTLFPPWCGANSEKYLFRDITVLYASKIVIIRTCCYSCWFSLFQYTNRKKEDREGIKTTKSIVKTHVAFELINVQGVGVAYSGTSTQPELLLNCNSATHSDLMLFVVVCRSAVLHGFSVLNDKQTVMHC